MEGLWTVSTGGVCEAEEMDSSASFLGLGCLREICQGFAQIIVGHGGNSGIRPDIDAGFDHIDDGINRENDTHEIHRHVDGGH